MNESEEWRLVVGWEEFYEVSSLGKVRSLGRVTSFEGRWGVTTRRFEPRPLKPAATHFGYLTVGLCRAGKARTRTVHSLVCEAFHGRPPRPGMQIAHGDGNPGNNSAENLRWATIADNAADRQDHGTVLAGEIHPNATLSSDDVAKIRKLKGETLKLTAVRFGISVGHVWNIQNNRSWKIPGY